MSNQINQLVNRQNIGTWLNQLDVYALIYIPGLKSVQHPESIIRLEGVDNYTNVYSVDQSIPVLASRSLVYFQRQLPGFLRVSKSSLINPAYVVRLVKKRKMLYLQLADDTQILISRRRVAETVAALNTLQDQEANK